MLAPDSAIRKHLEGRIKHFKELSARKIHWLDTCGCVILYASAVPVSTLNEKSSVNDVLIHFLNTFCSSPDFKENNPQATPRRSGHFFSYSTESNAVCMCCSILNSKDTPGPRCVPFKRDLLRKLKEVPFCVLEKSDGERRFM